MRVLVNLTPLVEKGRTKAHQYWPAEDADMVLENGWKLTCKPATRIQLENGEATLERRTILIKPGEEAAEDLNDRCQCLCHEWDDDDDDDELG